jgi:hypothetical protein
MTARELIQGLRSRRWSTADLGSHDQPESIEFTKSVDAIGYDVERVADR